MSRPWLMALDVGGGGGRCLLLEPESGRLASAFRAWRFRTAPGTGGLGVELDLDAAWRALADAAAEARERAGARSEDVAGIAASAMRLGTVVLGARGDTLLAAPNRDARAAGEGLRLAAEHGEALYEATGHWPTPIFPLARLLWLKANAPDELARATACLSLSDWVAWRLCGELAAEPSQAGASLLFDLARRDWSEAWIERFGLPRRLFPPVRQPGEHLGALGREAAGALGLRPGTPVAVGGADTQCALLGGGTLEPGEAMAVVGTTAPVQLVSDAPVVDPARRLWSGHHVTPGRWVLESNAGGMGEVLDWFARTLYADPAPDAAPLPHPAAALLAEAAESEPGAAGMHSTLGADVMNARELGAPLGHLCLCHLAVGADAQPRRHLARATVEGMAYALRANLEQVCETGGANPLRLAVGGGLSRSPFWRQLVADVCARPVRHTRTAEATALGTALLAGLGAGVFPDLAGAGRAARAGEDERTTSPDPGRAERYAELYRDWCALREVRAEADRHAVARAMPFVLEASRRGAPAPRAAWRPRILVTADLDAGALDRLGRLGELAVASYREKMRLLTGPSLVEALAGFEVFVTEVDVVDAASLAALPALRVVASCRGDAVNVDVDACTALGIPVLNAPGRNADAVADLTLAFLLALARKLREADAFLREPGGEPGDVGRMGRAFRQLRGRELWGKTVGLVGLGAVGAGVARRLRAFGARVVAHDPYAPPGRAARLGAELVGLDELLASSDFVSLHAPVVEETRGLLDREALAAMRPGACLVNTARAALVDEEALVAALREGHLAGAAVDVFAVEPPGADHPLLALPNVIATPHVGGNTEEVPVHQGAIVADDLERMLRAERPRFALNPVVLETFDWEKPRPAPDRALAERLARRPPPAVTDLQKQRRAPRPAPADEGAPGTGEGAAGGVPAPVREHVERLLVRFTEGLAADPDLARFAAGQQVVLQFSLTDLGLAFHLRLHDGEVRAAPGPADGDADVHLKMRAEVLDGMMTGRVNGMQAAMDGELAFSGDTAKAMVFQQVQKTVSRHYRAAREAVGAPDLSALSAPAARTPAAAAAPADAGDRVRDEIVTVVNELYAQQVITATGGNVSARIPGREELWITPSRLFKGDLGPEVLVRLDLAGETLDPGARAPSSERLMHCAAYRAKPEAGAVIHAHAPHATILANTGLPFLPISTEAAFFDDLPRVPFIMPGTRALADAIEEALRGSWAVLMVNHGILVAGRSLRSAADMVEIIERTAEVILGCHAVGREPPTLPEDVVATLRKMGDMIA